ncbi:MAG: (Fe-S)-binding protein [Deltaproteobacteria bacterium]|nr:(Fe-S)-binding protein [Deltaproteobacteria bacterium]
MYHPRDIIETIAGNLRATRNPFGIPHFMVNRWWGRSKLPRQGDALLFTGLMYQFIPYIEKSTGYLSRYEDTPLSRYVGYTRYVPSYLSGLGLAMITPRREKQKMNGILNNIVRVLNASRVDFYYRPELDHYSGILLYDLGDRDTFVTHARWLADRLKKAGVRKLITVDPHTTYALKELFPKYTGSRFEVHPYFEMIQLKGGNNGRRTVALHDPCFYGRYLGLSDVPAKALAELGIDCAELERSGAYTHCCGGPAESVSPRLADDVGRRRLAQLEGTGAPIVAMCPICLGNLRKLGADVRDLSSVLVETLS